MADRYCRLHPAAIRIRWLPESTPDKKSGTIHNYVRVEGSMSNSFPLRNDVKGISRVDCRGIDTLLKYKPFRHAAKVCRLGVDNLRWRKTIPSADAIKRRESMDAAVKPRLKQAHYPTFFNAEPSHAARIRSLMSNNRR